MRTVSFILLLLSFCEGFSADLKNVGVARVDVSPSYSVPLSGYGGRTKMSAGVEQRIWAKALAFNPGTENVAVMVTVDNCGVPFHVRREVLRRLKNQVKPERFAILSSHTHSAPMLRGVLENLFSRDLTPEERKAIDRYTEDLTTALVKVVNEAISRPVPAYLSWGVGKSKMAENRRYGSGPTDDDVPVLRVTDKKGKILAVLANYACHCTAISGKLMKVCGDWAGYTQEFIEEQFPGSTAMIAIGCAGDQRPAKRFGLEFAKENGAEVGRAIVKALGRDLKPIDQAPQCDAKQIDLPLTPARPRAEWEKLAKNKNRSFAYIAQKNLRRLDRGEELQSKVPYYVQSWGFGNDLLMVFLPGEVVVDYSVRLKHRFDRRRTWVNAYANDVPCYIPSERVLREGGYEGETAMRYYDRPERFAPGVENRILETVDETAPDGFTSQLQRPIAATDSTSYLTTKPGHYVQLVASEPQVVDPVVIDFGLDGKLWVAEMNDYPTGMDGDYQPGGRVKYLEDKDGDGFFETSTLFLEGIPFPTGITAWGEGVLVCAAPNILYAVDRDGDGRADDIRKLFTGFITDNYQARVNGIELGLDNWFYASGGLRGGTITNLMNRSAKPVRIASSDFRFSPDFQTFELASGNSQQGRVRDDWDNWFGNNNSSSLFGYPMHRHYRNRNPHIFLPSDRVYIPTGKEPERIYPTSELETRFNRPSHYNRVTSGCGPGIHRDSEIGAQYYGDAFICEPVHSVVRRLVLESDGPIFTGHRAPDEQTSEFLSSSDNWFRPAQAKTGPDGAIWVVDMHRGLIEHPRWVPEDRLKKIDVRAGANAGRIYRVLPSGKRVRPIPDLSDQPAAELVKQLATPNGTLRDLIHRELIFRGDTNAIPHLLTTVLTGKAATTRLYALCILDGLRASDRIPFDPLRDRSAHVRRHAVRIAESRTKESLIRHLTQELANDQDKHVRFQLALGLGNWSTQLATNALAKLAVKDMAEPWNKAAILSSAKDCAPQIFDAVAAAASGTKGRTSMLADLIGIIAATAPGELAQRLDAIIPSPVAMKAEDWLLIESLQDAFERNRINLASLKTPAVQRLKQIHQNALNWAADSGRLLSSRRAALQLVGRGFSPYDLPRLTKFLTSELQNDALTAMTRRTTDALVPTLLRGWTTHPPALRQQIISALLRRNTSELLDAIQAGTISPGEIDHLTRLRISRSSDEKITKRATQLIPVQRNTNRADVVKEYAAALTLNGDPKRGREVFQQSCASCHKLNGIGHHVGPDLAVYRNKNPRDILEAILDPNSVIEPRFTQYEIETKDGETHAGIIQSDSNAGITLLQAQGITQQIKRANIASIRASSLSLMPEGLEQAITREQMAALTAFLKSR